MPLIRILLLLVITTACGRPFWRPRPVVPEPFPEPASATSIQVLSIERGPCMDTSCKAYRYTYHRKGHAMYDSLSPVDARLVQQATATLDSSTFAALARAVLAGGFFRLQPRYSAGVTDTREATVQAVLLDTVKTVVEEDDAGPAAFHEVQSLLDSLGERLSWQVVPPQTTRLKE